jgi:hypothetical protein
MKPLALLIALAAALLGVWFASQRGFGLGGDVHRDVPPSVAALHRHFAQHGIATTVRLVRIELAGAQARALFTIKDAAERSFIVMWFGSADTAAGNAAALNASANPTLAESNGPFLLQLTHWSRDDPLSQQVLTTFRSFDAARAAALAR